MPTSPRPAAFKSLLSTAHELADEAAKVTMRHFRRPIPIDNKAVKGDFDPVTKADQGGELAMRKVLKRTFPSHGILGEEHGTTVGDGRYQWVLDPIDGTRAFISGNPMWGTLIGLTDKAQAIVGVLDHPFSQERLWSAETASYHRRGDAPAKRIKTRTCPDLSRATFMSTTPRTFTSKRNSAIHTMITDQVQLVRYGGDCYAYGLAVQGFVDVIVEPGLKPYDIVALIPIIERAGGRVTTTDGDSAVNGGDVVVTGDPKLHDAVLKMISKL
jgi:histidinol phosphatase-like enzyme (inositol monophosphatase family)